MFRLSSEINVSIKDTGIHFATKSKNLCIPVDCLDKFQKLFNTIRKQLNSNLTKKVVYLNSDLFVTFEDNILIGSRSSVGVIKLCYSDFDILAKQICENGLELVKQADQFEKIILNNLVRLLVMLPSEDRSVLLSGAKRKEEHVINKLVKIALKSSKLSTTNEYLQFLVTKYLKDDIHIFTFIITCHKFVQQ